MTKFSVELTLQDMYLIIAWYDLLCADKDAGELLYPADHELGVKFKKMYPAFYRAVYGSGNPPRPAGSPDRAKIDDALQRWLRAQSQENTAKLYQAALEFFDIPLELPD